MNAPYRKPDPTTEQLLAAAHALGHQFPPSADEHPTIAEMLSREVVALVRGYTDGDVNHVLQPVIGWFRLSLSKGETLNAEALEEACERMWEACEAEHALLAERKAARRAADHARENAPAAPQVVVISQAQTRPETISATDSLHGWETAVPVYVWNALRRATRRDSVAVSVQEMTERDVAPTGWLYTPTGARNLDDVLAAMWTCPEAIALRDVPHDSGQFREPHLSTMEQAQFAMNDLWAAFLNGASA